MAPGKLRHNRSGGRLHVSTQPTTNRRHIAAVETDQFQAAVSPGKYLDPTFWQAEFVGQRDNQLLIGSAVGAVKPLGTTWTGTLMFKFIKYPRSFSLQTTSALKRFPKSFSRRRQAQ